MIEKIILIGGGGHCKSVIDSIVSCGSFEIAGIIDVVENIGEVVCSIPIIGEDKDLLNIFNQGVKYAFITSGSVGNCDLRQRLYNSALKVGFIIPTIVDPTAIVARSTIIGQGTFVGKGCIINSCAIISDMAIINTGAIVDHDCKISKFVHIATGVTLCGTVKIGDYTHIGAGTTIIQGINIGEETLVGAGSLVVSDIGSEIKAFGMPCKEVGKWKSISL